MNIDSAKTEGLSPSKRALLERLAARRPDAAEPTAALGYPPIAIIGMGCRFGDCAGPDAFQRLLESGADAVGSVPKGRWRLDSEALRARFGVQDRSVESGCFIPEIEQFDAAFFGITPREAQRMDPQQRLLLEVAWEALEHAAIAPNSLRGAPVGVFVGTTGSDYKELLLAVQGRDADAYLTTGTSASVSAGRLSYFLGLQGPSLAVDTACSSSLVAIHEACRALAAGDCELALAGGVSLIVAPTLAIDLRRAGALSPSGRCKTFDADADGYVRSEGCGLLVLKPLARAQADGDPILAVVRASAVNQDGASNGLTAPSGSAQTALLRTALARAHLHPWDVQYLEAHGTGTKLGDPIELQAAAAAFGDGRAPDRPLLVGSVKTNIGHAEAAAGIAGIVKVVQAMGSGRLPRHLHLDTPNPLVAWDRLPLRVTTEPTAWPAGRRIAGVSGFGIGGTNAHVILEAAPEAPAAGAGTSDEVSLHLLPISARDEPALRDLAGRYAAWLRGDAAAPDQPPQETLARLCHTAEVGRSHFPLRAVFPGRTAEELAAGLSDFAAGRSGGAVQGRASASPRLALLFTGQGSQYPGMARGLYEHEPVFRTVLDRCAELLAPMLDRPLHGLLLSTTADDAAALSATRYTQPALFALEAALFELWRSRGVQPQWVMGHSVGELAAAYAAGVLTLEGGLRLVTARAGLMADLPGAGRMAALFADVETVAEVIDGTGLCIAAYNGAHQVISGPTDVMDTTLSALAHKGIRHQPLHTSQAFHSPLLDPMLARLGEVAQAIEHHPARLSLIGNLTGEAFEPGTELPPDYWPRHARAPVQFARGVETLAELGCNVLLEIGPAATLAPLAKRAWPGKADAQPTTIHSLRRDADQQRCIAEAAASLYTSGCRVHLNPQPGSGEGEPHGRRLAGLPTYPFQRSRHWIDVDQMPPTPVGTEDLSISAPEINARGDRLYRQTLDPARQPWLGGHRVFDHPIAPGALFASLAIGASPEGAEALLGFRLERPLPMDRPAEVQLIAPAAEDQTNPTLEIYSRGAADAPWVRRAIGRWAVGAEPAPAPSMDDPSDSLSPADIDAFHDTWASRGIHYAEPFRLWRRLRVGPDAVRAELQLPPQLRRNSSEPHPIVLDACLRLTLACAQAMDGTGVLVPVGWERLVFRGPVPAELDCLLRVRESGPTRVMADIQARSRDGRSVIEIQALRAERSSPEALRLPRMEAPDWFYEPRWIEQPLPRDVGGDSPWSLWVPIAEDWRRAWRASAQAQQATDERQAELYRELDRLAAGYIISALRDLGWRPRAGDHIDTGLLERLGVGERHRRLGPRLLQILGDHGWLEATQDAWRVAVDQGPPDLAEQAQSITRRFPDGDTEVALLAACGPRLATVLTEALSPLGLLFPGPDAGATRFYRQSPGVRAYNGRLALAVERLLAELPADRPVRIIEIGGGTGATTEHLLPRCPPRHTRYVFTDLSAGFFPAVRERLGGDHPFLEFEVLDIEQAPASQGFPGGDFDLVIAANVLHATADLPDVLEHCRDLLRPGGILALIEGTKRPAWLDLTFGLLDGWWRFRDEWRSDSPLISLERWRAALDAAGFVGVESSDPADPGQLAVILAGAGAPNARAPGGWMLIPDRQGIARRLAHWMQGQGMRCHLVESLASDWLEGLRDPASPSGEPQTLQGVIHLAALDSTPTPATTTETLARESRRHIADLLSLIQGLLEAGIEPEQGLWLITGQAQCVEREPCQGIAAAPIWGMARTIASELPQLGLRRVDLDADTDPVSALSRELRAADGEDQIAWRRGRRLVARLERSDAIQERIGLPARGPYGIAKGDRPGFDGLQGHPLELPSPGPGQALVGVQAVGLNFRDVLDTLGLLAMDTGPLGGELAGRILALGDGVTDLGVGDPVLGLATGAFATDVIVDARLLAKRPTGMTAATAAALPIACVTAALAFAGQRLMGGQRVLIHAASGGVGSAAIELARARGAEIHVTASAPKQAYLRRMGLVHVYDSRSRDFAEQILAATGGNGVDLVLNSLTGDGFIKASLGCLARGGRFVEIGKRGIWSEAQVHRLRPDVHYEVLAVDALMHTEPGRLGETLRGVVDELAAGRISPPPCSCYPLRELPLAMRTMADARHVGKLVLTLPRWGAAAIRADQTYLITGGLGGIGLEVARWLVDAGARFVALNGRRAPSEPALRAIEALRIAGARVEVVLADVGRIKEVDGLIDRVNARLPRLCGIFHCAGLLRDRPVRDMTPDDCDALMAPKVYAAWRLHERTLDQELDCFVLFGSAAGVLGHRGQANHAAANAALDQLAWHRRALGLAATAIDWGAWSRVGEAAERRASIEPGLAASGFGWLSPEQGMAALEQALTRDAVQTAFLPVDWARYFGVHAHPQPLLTSLRPRSMDSTVETDAPRSAAAPPEQTEQSAVAAISEQVRQIMRLGQAPELDADLFALGLDSLMSVELVNLLQARLAPGETLPSTLVADHPSIAALVAYFDPGFDAKTGAGSDVGRSGCEAPAALIQTNMDQRESAVLRFAPGSPWRMLPELFDRQSRFVNGWTGERRTPESLIVGQNIDGPLPPLFWVFQASHEPSNLARYLAPGRPLYAMRSGYEVTDNSDAQLQILAMAYVQEIEQLHPQGPIYIGGNCGGAMVAMAIAQHLVRRGRWLPLLVLMEWFFPLQSYAGHVALLFGEESILANPYRRHQRPELAWRRAWPDHRFDFIPGRHGSFLREPRVQKVADLLEGLIADAVQRAPRILPSDGFDVRLSWRQVPERWRKGRKAKLRVGVENRCDFPLAPGEFSGLMLVARWRTSDGAVGDDRAVRIALPGLARGKLEEVSVRLRVPMVIGPARLDLAIVEEGLPAPEQVIMEPGRSKEVATRAKAAAAQPERIDRVRIGIDMIILESAFDRFVPTVKD